MLDNGFDDVAALLGGIQVWSANGYPTATN